MPFDDNDLKRLKEEIKLSESHHGASHESLRFRALLTRMEAAELALSTLANEHSDCTTDHCAEDLKTWRKAAGK